MPKKMAAEGGAMKYWCIEIILLKKLYSLYVLMKWTSATYLPTTPVFTTLYNGPFYLRRVVNNPDSAGWGRKRDEEEGGTRRKDGRGRRSDVERKSNEESEKMNQSPRGIKWSAVPLPCPTVFSYCFKSMFLSLPPSPILSPQDFYNISLGMFWGSKLG